jgi:hypothetical protein
MESGEDFWVRFFESDATGWQTVADYDSGDEFTNGNFYQAEVIFNSSQYNFSNDHDFKFECDASNNRDYIYLDEIRIEVR